jgi:hypothetical protein
MASAHLAMGFNMTMLLNLMLLMHMSCLQLGSQHLHILMGRKCPIQSKFIYWKDGSIDREGSDQGISKTMKEVSHTVLFNNQFANNLHSQVMQWCIQQCCLHLHFDD